MKLSLPFFRKNLFVRENFIKILVFLLILLSFLISISNSVPFKSVDEGMIANWIWGFNENPFPVNQYPPLFLYLHFLLSLLYKSVFLLLGIIKTGYEFLYTGLGYNFMIEAGRYISAIFGMLTVYTIYKSGKKFFSLSIAFVSLLLIAFNEVFILHSHIFKSDILVTLLISVSLYFLLDFVDKPEKRSLFSASFFFGLAFAAKYNIAVFFVVIIYAIFIRKKILGFFRSFSILFLGGFFGFIIASPNWIVNPLGNFKKLIQVYNINDGSVYIQHLSPFSIYAHFISDIKDQFGIILFVALIAGIVFSFFKKNEKGILLSIFLIIYILLFGFTGFYGRRFLLPIFPAIILLTSKFLLEDIINIRKINGNVKKAITVMFFIPIVYFSFDRVITEMRRFNMLNVESKSESTLKYRREHNLNDRKYVFGSQLMTPRMKGDVRFRRNFRIKKYFRRRGIPDFIQVNTSMKWDFEKFGKTKDPYLIDISNFKVFHKIEREKVQDWDYNIHFLYKISKELRKIDPVGTLNIELPTMYYENGGDFFYPKQRYEKTQGLLMSNSGYCFTRIYSKNRIGSFEVKIFSTNSLPLMKIGINGREKVIRGLRVKELVREIHIERINESEFYKQYMYSVKICPEGKFNPVKIPDYYAVVKPIFEQKLHSEKFGLNNINLEKIPEIFSSSKYPDWVKKVYKDTSVDLSLYEFINTFDLTDKLKKDCCVYESPIFPLESGDYLLTFVFEPLVGDFFRNGNGEVEYEIYSSKAKKLKSFKLKHTKEMSYPIKVDSDLSFFRFKVKNLRKNNLLLKSVSVKPDIIKFIRKKYIK